MLVVNAQNNKHNDCWFFYSDTTTQNMLWGCKDRFGNLTIKPKFSMTMQEDFCSMALVNYNSKWIAINKEEKVLFTPFIAENLPDNPSLGYIRIIENNKIGFANKNGEVIIPAQFDYAELFEYNFAAFNMGCKWESRNEMNFIIDGKWGVINKSGRIVVPAKYKKIIIHKNRTFEVWSYNREHLLLDRAGRVIRSYFE